MDGFVLGKSEACCEIRPSTNSSKVLGIDINFRWEFSLLLYH